MSTIEATAPLHQGRSVRLFLDPGRSQYPPWPSQLRQLPGLDPAAAPLRGRGSGAGILGEVLDRVAAGCPAVVLIEGEAGIGKTRLLGTAVEGARARGMQLARGRAEELEQARPFGLVAAAFGCVRSAGDPRRAAIAELLASPGARVRQARHRLPRPAHRPAHPPPPAAAATGTGRTGRGQRRDR